MYDQKKDWDVENIASQLRALHFSSKMSMNDKLRADIKKDLYQIKFLVDNLLKKIPEFENERNWLENQDKVRLVKILKIR